MLYRQISIILMTLSISACSTTTINSDGSVYNKTLDNAKLSKAYTDLAVEYQQRDVPQIALERINLAITTDPNNIKAYMVRGMIYHQLDNDRAAEKDFKYTLNTKPDYAEAQVNYAVFLCDKGRYAEAANYFAQALNEKLYHTPELVYYNRGNCNYLQNKYSLANSDYLLALKGKNPPSETYLALAKLQYAQKNYSLARSYWTKFAGATTPSSLSLGIEILQSLISQTTKPELRKQYKDNRNKLISQLIEDYPNSDEAKRYGAKPLIKDPTTMSVTKVVRIADKSVEVVPNKPSLTKQNLMFQNEAKTARLKTTSQRRYVVVNKGDTLYSIARNNSLTQEQIRQYNKLNSETVMLGAKLYLEP